jgi:hypothetical protein
MCARRILEPAPFIEILDGRTDMQKQELAVSIRTHLMDMLDRDVGPVQQPGYGQHAPAKVYIFHI